MSENAQPKVPNSIAAPKTFYGNVQRQSETIFGTKIRERTVDKHDIELIC